jgi:hypothetical protein
MFTNQMSPQALYCLYSKFGMCKKVVDMAKAEGILEWLEEVRDRGREARQAEQTESCKMLEQMSVEERLARWEVWGDDICKRYMSACVGPGPAKRVVIAQFIASLSALRNNGK